MKISKITPAIGAEVSGVDFSAPITTELHDEIYQALIENHVIFFRNTDISPTAHLEFAKGFGELDEPHPLYPHVEGHQNIVLLENNTKTPPDTNSWHTDLTFKAEQPFASVLVARTVPEIGGDTMWSSLYAAYDGLPDGMKQDLEALEAVHDMGDFRNSFGHRKNGRSAVEQMNEGMAKFGQNIRPLIGQHPITGRNFLNYNEAYVVHILGLTTNESTSLKTVLANHMNRPEYQVRWRWRAGDIAMWDNRITMHYALADYLPAYRCMNRITVIRDRRDQAAIKTA